MTENRRKSLPERVASWADRRHFISVRAATLYITLWMTYKVTEWAFAYATIATGSGVETAAVIAAVTAPVCALQGFVFGQYMKGKSE